MTSLLAGMAALTKTAVGADAATAVDRSAEPYISAERLATADPDVRARVREYLAGVMLGGVAADDSLDEVFSAANLREHPHLGVRIADDGELLLTVAYRRASGRGTLRGFRVDSRPGRTSPHCGLITPAMLGLDEAARSTVLVVQTVAEALTAALVLRTPAVFLGSGDEEDLGTAVAALVAAVADADREMFGDDLAPVRRVVVLAPHRAELDGRPVAVAVAKSGLRTYAVGMPVADLVQVASVGQILGEVAHAALVDPLAPAPVAAERLSEALVIYDPNESPFFSEDPYPDPLSDDPLESWWVRFGDGTEADLTPFGVPAVVQAGNAAEYATSLLGVAPFEVRDARPGQWERIACTMSTNGKYRWGIVLDEAGRVAGGFYGRVGDRYFRRLDDRPIDPALERALAEIATLRDEVFELGTEWKRGEKMWGFGVLGEAGGPAVD